MCFIDYLKYLKHVYLHYILPNIYEIENYSELSETSETSETSEYKINIELNSFSKRKSLYLLILFINLYIKCYTLFYHFSSLVKFTL